MIQVNQPFLALQCFLLEMAVLYVILTAAILYPYVSFRCPSRDGQAEEAIARIKRAKRFKYFQLFCCIVIFIYHGVGVLLPPGLRVIYVWVSWGLSSTNIDFANTRYRLGVACPIQLLFDYHIGYGTIELE